ncbi:uncharacterized protein BDV14DRAFT_207475 [Aspergillus stella-maris]|uniref:uncharacterized protein n=1 Tax=Aspergillus stella-maris TaxID=1810926 RepID=UPI003CCDE375
MAFLKFTSALCAVTTAILTIANAQAPTGTPYTDAATNISFTTWDIPSASGTGPLKFGLTLPATALETDATDFIGYLTCKPATGWCGISLGGSMTDSLLVVAYADPESKTVKHTLRYTSQYEIPTVYKGNATLLPIHTEIQEDSFTSVFHCKDCLHWEQNGDIVGAASTSSGMLDLAFAVSPEEPSQSDCADEAVFVRHANQGTWVAFVDEGGVSAEFEKWAGMAEGGDRC